MMLTGIRVLEFGQNVAAPYGAAILGDLGAEVIKIEKPGGEEGRKLGPPVSGDDSAWFHQVNRNKKSVVIDVKSEAGRARLLRLMSTADVFLHNVRPGALDKMGLGPASVTALYPKLIYVDARAFGHVGPLANDPGYELLMQASSGLMSVTGGEESPPTRAGPSIVDLTTGMWIAIGALAAIVKRAQGGAAAS
jgi:crotonobetainyl-CoA:carnitine CoA-transferase CaiB-like acyl-CoA transferase